MGNDQEPDLAAATAQLGEAGSVLELLRTTARTLVDTLEADACTISRAIGDLLIDLVDYSARGPVQLGHGYLISDYQLTREVLERRDARTVWLEDPEADPSEADLLRQLGFDALLMLPLESDESAWGLVEVYAVDRGPLDASTADIAGQIVAKAGSLLTKLLEAA